LNVGCMTQGLRDGLTMNKKIVDDMIVCFAAILFAWGLVMVINSINSSREDTRKDYILHSITSDGTAFYLYMDEEEYQQWASENHIKIKKLQLEEK